MKLTESSPFTATLPALTLVYLFSTTALVAFLS